MYVSILISLFMFNLEIPLDVFGLVSGLCGKIIFDSKLFTCKGEDFIFDFKFSALRKFLSIVVYDLFDI